MKKSSDRFAPIFKLVEVCKADIEQFSCFDMALQDEIYLHLINKTDFMQDEIYQFKNEALTCFDTLFAKPENALSKFLKTEACHTLEPQQISDLIACVKAIKIAQATLSVRRAEIAFSRANYLVESFDAANKAEFLKNALIEIDNARKLYQALIVPQEIIVLVPVNQMLLLSVKIFNLMFANTNQQNALQDLPIVQPASSASTQATVVTKPKKKKKKKAKSKVNAVTAITETKLVETKRAFFDKQKLLQTVQAKYYSGQNLPHADRKLERSCSYGSFFEPCTRVINQYNPDVQTTLKENPEIALAMAFEELHFACAIRG